MSVLLSPALLERTANDIRGPAGLVSFLLHEVLNQESPPPPELLERARRGVDRLLRIADRLSRAAQLESNDLVLVPSRVELGQLIRSCVEQAQKSEQRPEINVTFVGLDAASFVECDAFWVSAALIDVATAAIHRAHSQVLVSLGRETTGPILSILDDGLRSTLVADVFADLPFVLAGATLERHGFRLKVDNPPAADGGLIHGGRIVLAFLGS